MATDAGAIRYTVEADTGDLLAAEKAVDKSTNAIANDFNKVDAAAKKTETQMTKTAKGVKTGIAGMGRSAGQAGIQLQQFIGQVQGGQSAMLALSQQSADLGFVLGAPLLGAIVGISASLVGLLAPSLMEAITGTKDFAAEIENLKDNLDDLGKLGKNRLIAVQAAATEESNKKLKESIKLTNEIRELEESRKQLTKDLSKESKLDVQKSNVFSPMAGAGSGTSREGLAKAQLAEVNKELRTRKATLEEVNEEVRKQNALAMSAGDQLKSLVETGKTKTKEDQKQVTAAEKLTTTLEAQRIALEQGEEAAFRYATAQQLNLKAGEEIPANIDAQISALFKLKKAQDEARQKSQLEGRVQSIGATPTEQIEARYQTELELLRQAEEQKIEIIGTYEQRRVELRRRADEQIAVSNKKETEKSILSYEALENQIIGTFAGIASGAMDGKDAMHSLAQSILTQVIGALIKMGIQSVIGQTTAAATGAATAATLATAYAPAAALASLASFGANAAPAAAGITSTTALAQGAALAGGRQFGGQVSAGNMYRVGEDGPEVYSSGGKNYMIPGDSGKVTPNNQMGGGVTVNVNNNAAGVEVQATPSSDGRTIDIAVRQAVNELTRQAATGNGKFIQTMRKTTNLQTKATR